MVHDAGNGWLARRACSSPSSPSARRAATTGATRTSRTRATATRRPRRGARRDRRRASGRRRRTATPRGCSSCSTSARASTTGATASPRCSGRRTTPNPRRCGCCSRRRRSQHGRRPWVLPLHASVFDPDDCHECAQILVDANADLTYRKDGLTPLEYAKYREDRPRVVKVLEDAVAAASGGSGGGDGDGEAGR